MRISNIELKNFRNYPDLNLKITSDMVILSGPNAVGKTNLLESVYFAALFKSFRDDAEYIFLKGSNTAEIKATVEKNGDDHVLEIFLEKRDKIYANFKLDGVKQKRKDAQGFVTVVIFDPTDVDLFTKTPETRRKYLNMVLSQKSLLYADALANYKKVLGHKNKLLLDIRAGLAKRETLSSWNDQLIQYGTEIIMERKRFIAFLNQNISEVYASISKFNRPVEVLYEGVAGDTEEEVKQNLTEAIAKVVDREIAQATSVVGPHRDDFHLESEGLYLVSFSSRGERRGQVLSLKILELEYLSRGDDKPVLLLDDVLSEFDETRRTFLLKYLQDRFQTFITTTHPLEMTGQHVTLAPSIVEE